MKSAKKKFDILFEKRETMSPEEMNNTKGGLEICINTWVAAWLIDSRGSETTPESKLS